MKSINKSLAIIGAGSSGLITLKSSLQQLKGWDIVCYEKSSSIRGCWGDPYPGFVSTSTKFTTQFNCHIKYGAGVSGKNDYSEFFQGGEYGDYLEDFANVHKLTRSIQLNTSVSKIERTNESFCIRFSDTSKPVRTFTHVIVCTGLAQRPKTVETDIPVLNSISDFKGIRQKTILVIGGGESAADTANRLADSKLQNKVYISLKRGIRVSPRYHPIRGVPSDFLRNRLMLSVSPSLRNRIGQKFVEARIKYQSAFQKLFPSKRTQMDTPQAIKDRRRDWDLRLTQSAKDQLFNVFHNKSDGFLDAIAEERIQVIGAPTSDDYKHFNKFENEERLTIYPDLIVSQIGYQTNLSSFFDPPVAVSDFYQGCVHHTDERLYLIGFARPIIGNIPTIAEQQAKYVISLISENTPRPPNLPELNQADRQRLRKQFPTLNSDVLYPVEMFPYCDALAHQRNAYPSLRKVKSLKRWLKIMLSPASTTHYIDEDYVPEKIDQTEIYTPSLINLLLLIVKAFDQLLSRKNNN